MEAILKQFVDRDSCSIVLSYFKPLPYIEELLTKTNRLYRAIEIGQRTRVFNCPLQSPRDWQICREDEGKWNISFGVYENGLGVLADWCAYAQACKLMKEDQYEYPDAAIPARERTVWSNEYDEAADYLDYFVPHMA